MNTSEKNYAACAQAIQQDRKDLANHAERIGKLEKQLAQLTSELNDARQKIAMLSVTR